MVILATNKEKEMMTTDTLFRGIEGALTVLGNLDVELFGEVVASLEELEGIGGTSLSVYMGDGSMWDAELVARVYSECSAKAVVAEVLASRIRG